MKREPGGDQGCDDQEKAKISETEMLPFEVRYLRLAGLPTSFVLLGRGRVEGMHRGIIAYLFLGNTQAELLLKHCFEIIAFPGQLEVLKEASRRSRTKTMWSRMASRASRLESFLRAW